MGKRKRMTKREKEQKKRLREQARRNAEFERLINLARNQFNELGGGNFTSFNKVLKERSINPAKVNITKQDIKKIKQLATYSGVIRGIRAAFSSYRGKDRVSKWKELMYLQDVADFMQFNREDPKKSNKRQLLKYLEGFVWSLQSAFAGNAYYGESNSDRAVSARWYRDIVISTIKKVISSDNEDEMAQAVSIIYDYTKQHGGLKETKMYWDDYLSKVNDILASDLSDLLKLNTDDEAQWFFDEYGEF